MIDSDTWIFSEEINEWDDKKLNAQLIIITLDKVGTSNYQQYFLDGTSHCVFSPIKDWAENMKDEAKSKTTKGRYNTIMNKCDKYINKYKGGVPESDISNIVNDLQINIEIDLPSTMNNDTKYIYHRSQKKPLTTFRFVNTRLNHIEVNEVRSLNNYEEVSQEELNKIYKQSIENNEFILYKETKEGVVQINTLSKIYKLNRDEDEYCIAMKEFEEKNNLRDYKIEMNQNEDLTNFLFEHRGHNLSTMIRDHPDFVDEDYYRELLEMETDEYAEEWDRQKKSLKNYQEELLELKEDWEIDGHKKIIRRRIDAIKTIEYIESFKQLNHIDMKASYANGHNCDYYAGYLGKITDFRKTDKIEGIGIYMIYDIKYDNEILKGLKVLHEGNAYPSPELEFYRENGVEFKISMGCWGTRFDIEWTPDMMKEVDGTKNYCKFYGCLSKLNKVDSYKFNCKDVEFAKLQNWDEDCDVRYSEYLEVGLLDYKKKFVYHSAQIENFIHGYCRISMVQQCLRFGELNQIIAIQKDGIYYDGSVEIGHQFREKKGKSLRWIYGHEGFMDEVRDKAEYYKLPEPRTHLQHEIHLGAGGTGKTYNNLMDKGLVNPLFVAPSWKLSRTKQKEFNVNSSVFYYLTTDDPDIWRSMKRKYNTFIIDEISMLNNNHKELIMKRFPDHKIIFCGDIGYQLPPVEGDEFKKENLPVFYHQKSYRCKCEKLKKRLDHMRKDLSKRNYRINCIDYCKNLKLDIVDKNSIDYKVEDLIICKTRASAFEGKDNYTEKYADLEKYIVLENTRDYSNGEILYQKIPKVSMKKRHGFTIHSIQGETAQTQLFIDCNKITDLRMLYTALSRAKYLHQVVLMK